MKTATLIIIMSITLAVIFGCGEKSEVMAGSRAEILIASGDSLFDINQKADAVEVYKSAADTALAEKNNSALTEAYSQVARCYLSMDKKEEGRPWLQKAEQTAKDTEPYGWTRYLGVKGRYLWKDAAAEKKEVAPEASEAAKVFTELYDYAQEHKLYDRAIDAANMMSIVGDKDSRVDWSLKGIKAAEEGNLRAWLAPLWNNLGWTYDDMGMYDKSLDALMKARRYHYIKGDPRSMLIADWSVAHAFRMTGQIDSSLAWSQRAAIWAKDMYDEDNSPESAEWLGMCYKEIGEASLVQGDDKRAMAGFRSAKMYLDQANMKEWDEKGYNELVAKIDKLAANINKKR